MPDYERTEVPCQTTACGSGPWHAPRPGVAPMLRSELASIARHTLGPLTQTASITLHPISPAQSAVSVGRQGSEQR